MTVKVHTCVKVLLRTFFSLCFFFQIEINVVYILIFIFFQKVSSSFVQLFQYEIGREFNFKYDMSKYVCMYMCMILFIPVQLFTSKWYKY